MYKHTGIGWISVQEKCLRIVSFLGTKSELMNVSVMWMVTLCHGGKSGYKNSCNKIVIQLSFSRHIAVWEGHLMLYVCKFSINSCKILWKIKKHLLRTKGIAHHFPVFVNIVQCKCSPSFIFFFLPEMTRVSLYSFAVWLSVFAMYCRSPPTQKDPVWPAC